MTTILIAEDDAEMTAEFTHALEGDGYKIIAVKDGPDALRSLYTEEIDVVILDVMMPNIDGWAFLKMKAKDPKLAKIPVIIVSREARALSTVPTDGAVVMVGRPFSHEHLRRILQHLSVK